MEQCLCSVQKAISAAAIEAEIIVIDNNSPDKSIEYLQPEFKSVQFVANTENTGFAKACNQGAAMARGKFLLFLNPDTIIPEDCLALCIDFFVAHPHIGALGVSMIDGSGQFLKESKRAFPSPLTSFFKLAGLSNLFPRSKTFARYHLGHLDEHHDHEVDVLAGAFIMIRKEVFESAGRFDETFFMYGEDVDLSFRVQSAGYKNYYFAGTTIIHFKGESTRKGSLNYVRMFYNAMRVFVRKHYGGSRARIFSFFIHLAIWIRAGIAAVGRFIQWVGLPAIDAILIFLSFRLVKYAWSEYVKPDVVYPDRLLWIVFPLFTVFYLLVAYYAGLYDKLYKRGNVLRSTIIATIALLVVYALLPERFRFSRGIIVFGAAFAFVMISILRWLFVHWKLLQYDNGISRRPHVLIAGTETEARKVQDLIGYSSFQKTVLGRVAVVENDEGAISNWKNLKNLSAAVPFSEVIFCEGALSFKDIIEARRQLQPEIKTRVHASSSQSIVGSDSKDFSGEALAGEIKFSLAGPYRRRMKRLFDVMTSLLFLVTFPVHLFAVRKPGSFFKNCFDVLTGVRTWIGYAGDPSSQHPVLRKGVLGPNGIPLNVLQKLPHESIHQLNLWYAREYETLTDVKLVLKNYRRLGG